MISSVAGIMISRMKPIWVGGGFVRFWLVLLFCIGILCCCLLCRMCGWFLFLVVLGFFGCRGLVLLGLLRFLLGLSWLPFLWLLCLV